MAGSASAYGTRRQRFSVIPSAARNPGRFRHWLAALLLWLPLAAQAHTRGTSYSFWTLDAQGATAELRVSQLDLTRLELHPQFTPGYAEKVSALLAERIQLWAGDTRCVPAPGQPRIGRDGWLLLRLGFSCPQVSGQGYAIRSSLLHEVATSHLHFARIRQADGSLRERVLTYAEPVLRLDQPAAGAPATLAGYLALGVEHILTGWDHMAFVLALVLLAASLREVAIVATGFTLAHSLTLALAVLGVVQTRGEVVEALIGFSIALVAIENLWLRGGRERWVPALLVAGLLVLALAGFTRLPLMVLLGLALFSACHFGLLGQSARPARLRLALAFVFGLVHGFGFAGIMAELELPASRLAPALLGFNAGVELGQLGVILLAWPLLLWLRRRPAGLVLQDGGSALICALGTYWFLVRSLG